MTDREKLIELLDEMLYNLPQACDFADHLIANGVTVQKRGTTAPTAELI